MSADGELSIKHNMLWNTVGSLTNLGCQWLITVFVVRFAVDFDTAGVYSLAMSIFNMFSQLAQYRMYTVQISDVKHENTVGEYFTFRLITVGISLLVLSLYAVLTCRINSVPAIILYAVYKSAGLLIDVMHASDQVAHRMDFIGKSLILQGISALTSFVIVFGWFKSLEGALTCMAITTVFIGAFYDFPRSNGLDFIQLGISPSITAGFIRDFLPIVLGGIAASAAPSIPRQYLSSVMGDSALGIYASVAAPVAIVQMGATYVYNPLLSYLVEYYIGQRKESFYGLIKKIIFGIVIIGVVSSITLEFVGKFLLSLIYGSGIAEHAYLLLPMLFCAFLNGVTWFINDLLVSLKNYKGVFVGSLGSLIATLLVMIPAQILFGLNGVTYTNIISIGVCLVYQSFVLRNQSLSWFIASNEGAGDE